MIEVKNLSFKYQDNLVLKNINLTINPQEYLLIIGSNGSGKSTLAKLLTKIENRYRGEILIDGNNYRDTEIRNQISIVFQNPEQQFIASSVEDDIAFSLENLQYPSEVIAEKVDSLLGLIEMEKYRNYSSENLSGGQMQKVAIASILALDTKYLILDEATSMLDSESKAHLLALIKKLHLQEKKSIISISHDMEEILLADRIVLLNEGTIIFDGNARQLFKQKELLIKHQLSLPFIWQVIEQFNLEYTDKMEGVINQLCQKLQSKI